MHEAQENKTEGPRRELDQASISRITQRQGREPKDVMQHRSETLGNSRGRDSLTAGPSCSSGGHESNLFYPEQNLPGRALSAQSRPGTPLENGGSQPGDHRQVSSLVAPQSCLLKCHLIQLLPGPEGVLLPHPSPQLHTLIGLHAFPSSHFSQHACLMTLPLTSQKTVNSMGTKAVSAILTTLFLAQGVVYL